jgi:phospholipid/cholesterol/gamma-HCH transport system ATP-binding protein
VSDHLIEASDLVKRFGRTEVLRGVSFRLDKGETLVIMGGSGSGKTVLLRTVAGLIRADGGGVRVFGIEITRLSEEELLPIRRRMGYVFQGAALFDSLSVYDNVAFPLREHAALSEEMIRDIVLMKLNAVGLRGAAGLRISEVSGGMARRIALARAIAMDPELIMYDEPFAGLDLISMGVAAQLIRKLTDATGSTALVVSHDVPECMAISDHVILMAGGGRIVAQGTPDELMNSTDPEVRQFVRGEPDGPVKFHYAAPPLAQDFRLVDRA